jgi:hypothetical protein
MIKNFIAGGCSFTCNASDDWPSIIAQKYNPAWHRNLARGGAGNYYIAESVIHCLNTEKFDPKETLVIIMWSGYSRLDLQVTEQFFKMLEHYRYKTEIWKNHYVFSGGELGGWQNDLLLGNVFKSLYAVTNHEILANQTLNHMLRTQLYLEHHGYNYKFLSFINYWQNTKELISRQDYSLKIFNNLLYDEILKANWIFNNDKKDCFYEFAKERGLLLGDNFHPNNQAHKEFAHECIIPHIKKYFNDQ